VCELANHLSARAVLNQQGIFATYLRAPRYVGHFDKQGGVATLYGGDTAINEAFVGMHFAAAEAQVIGVVVACCDDTTKYVA
jgi:hypothetical protein